VFYNQYVKLCNSINKAPTAVAVDIGFQKSVVTRWKKNNATPTDANLKKIADYFGVTVDYLLGKETEKEKTSSSLDKELEGVEFALFGEVKELTDEEKEDILEYIRFKKSQRK